MKHFILTLSLLIGALVFAPASSTANASAEATQIVAGANTNTAIDLEQFEGKKGGFVQKMMAKKIAKKMKKALDGAGSDDGKLVAILAHLTIIGFIIALIMHMGDKKTSLGGYHLAQTFGLMIMGLIIAVISIIPILGWIIGGVFAILMLINWIVGLIHALNEEEKPMPIFGKMFEKNFRSLFN